MTRIVWISLALVYALFTFWYTSCGGPLTEEEVATVIAAAEAGGGSAEDVARMRHFLENDTGDDFVMVNLIDSPEKPKPVPGLDAGETTEEVMARYMAHMWPELLKRACHPVLMGTPANTATMG